MDGAISRPVHRRSAGGLVVHGDEILLIATHGGRRWQLPKGGVEPGEKPEETAVREIREETGVTGRILSSLPTIEYSYQDSRGRSIHKQVDYYLLEYVNGDPSNFDPREVYRAAWLPWEEGLARLTFDNEREVVKTAWRRLGGLEERRASTATGHPGTQQSPRVDPQAPSVSAKDPAGGRP